MTIVVWMNATNDLAVKRTLSIDAIPCYIAAIETIEEDIGQGLREAGTRYRNCTSFGLSSLPFGG